MDDSDETVSLELTRAEALVLFEWLHDGDDPTGSTGPEVLETPRDPAAARPFEQAVQGALWSLTCSFERTLHEPFAPDYDDRLDEAVLAVRRQWYDVE